MIRYYWQKEISKAYSQVIGKVRELYNKRYWLGESLIDSKLLGERNVSDESPDSIASQFYTYMPAHSFKVQHLIKDLLRDVDLLPLTHDLLPLTHDLLPLTHDRAAIAIIDIGCGGATASTALINHVLQRSFYPKNTRFLFIGIDTSIHAIQLYDWMMQEHSRIPELTNRVDYHAVIKGLPEALPYIAEGLYRARQKWQIPSLNDVWIIQSNVVRPLHSMWASDIQARNLLDMSPERSLIPDQFGDVEARTYEQLLQLSEADRMVIMTVATQDFQKETRSFGDSVGDVFRERNHEVISHKNSNARLVETSQSVFYTNPRSSYWFSEKHKKSYSSTFYADIQYIKSKGFLADRAWQEIISMDNLKLAWARVRAAMMRESFVDEIEIRGFDASLDANLKKMQNRLLTYTTRLSDFPRFYYAVPKDKDTERPRALQSIQEEILAVAVIQVLGRTVQELMSRNYGYRLQLDGKTEYLYRPWLRSYSRFRRSVARAIEGSSEDAMVLHSDIENFYPSIPQDELFKSICSRFHIESSSRTAWLESSSRTGWLLRQIIKRDNDSNAGVLQGPLASGFWANLYLLALDAKFSDEYQEASFFRYVDDIVMVVHRTADSDKVRQDLQRHVEALGLRLSEDKTYTETQKEAEQTLKEDDELSELGKKFHQLTVGLYFTSYSERSRLQQYGNQEWWDFIKNYQMCLAKLGVHIEASRLSRKVWQYVQDPILRSKSSALDLPDFQLMFEDEQQWIGQFRDRNTAWVGNYDRMVEELSRHLKSRWSEWKRVNEEIADLGGNAQALEVRNRILSLKKYQTHVTFALNRLSILNYRLVLDEIVEIFSSYPYVLKSHRFIFDHLALQGHFSTLEALWQRLETSSIQGRAYLRALIIRAWRFSDLSKKPEKRGLLLQISLDETAPSIEALMATETLILGTTHTIDATTNRRLFERANRVRENCPQLARNLTILAQRQENREEQSELLRGLRFDLDLDNETYKQYERPNSLDDLVEPDILREKYYYSRYPDNAEEFEGDYF